MLKRITLLTAIIAFSGILQISCNKHSYPCPGLGLNNEADMSQFDESGNPTDPKARKGTGRIDKTSGLVTKKKPKVLQNKRKTHI